MRRTPPLTPTRSPQGSVDCPNLEFEYGDADGHGAELAGEAAFGCRVAINGLPNGGAGGGWMSSGIVLAVIAPEGLLIESHSLPGDKREGRVGAQGSPCAPNGPGGAEGGRAGGVSSGPGWEASPFITGVTRGRVLVLCLPASSDSGCARPVALGAPSVSRPAEGYF